MIAIAVLGVLLTVAVPGFNQLVLSNRQVAATNEFIGAIQLARSTAITRNSRATVCASSDQDSCGGGSWSDGWIAFVDGNGNQQRETDEVLLKAQGEVSNIQITSGDFGLALSFASNGRVTQPGGQFFVCDSRGSEYGKVIILSASGRPRTGKTQIDGSAPSC